MTDYSKFRLSLKRLQEQYRNYASQRSLFPELTREAIAESVIHRFETCFDSMWKVLKHHLINELGIPKLPNSPKPILKRAFENDLLDMPMDRWLDYANKRVGTAHDYSKAKADACLAIVDGFIDDAISLYETLTDDEWQ